MDVVLQCVGFQNEGCFPVEVDRKTASVKAEGNRAVCYTIGTLWQTLEWRVAKTFLEGNEVEQGTIFSCTMTKTRTTNSL